MFRLRRRARRRGAVFAATVAGPLATVATGRLATRKYQAPPAIAINNAAIATMSGASAERFFGSGRLAPDAGLAPEATPTSSE